jgi:transposase
MLTLPPGARLLLATSRVDGRKGINGLSTLVRSQFLMDPLSGTLFVFFTKRADIVRVLYWDRDGYVLTTKRLEKGHFRVPWRSETGHVTLEAAELLLVLEGLDLSGVTRRVRWKPTPKPSCGEEKIEKELDAGI